MNENFNKTLEEQEIERLERAVSDSEKRLNYQRKIQQLKQIKQSIDEQNRSLNGPRYFSNFNKDKLKFWAIAAVCSIAASVILFRVIEKLF